MSGIYRAFLANESSIRRVFARYFRHQTDVEDLTQETFVRCFAAELKAEIHDPKSFLLRSAKNLAFSERKKKFRTTTDHIEDSGGSEVYIDESNVCAETSLDGRRKLAAFTQALAILPDDCRQAFVMRKVQGMKLTQIAERLDVSVSTVQNRIARALLLCEEDLRKKGYEPKEFGRSASVAKTSMKSKKGRIVSLASSYASHGRDYEV